MEKDSIPNTAPPEEEEPNRAAPVKPEPSAFAPDWQPTSQPVFVVEDSFYRSRTPPRPVHWSIAWSDLMMTMFILFLTLFAHQRTHQDVLAHGKPNTIADETIPVQADEAKSSLVFHPISQEISRKTTGQMKETSLPSREQTGADVLIRHKTVLDQTQTQLQPSMPEISKEQQAAAAAQHQAEQTQTQQKTTPQTQEQTKREELITGIYDLSKVTLANEKLERFASVELVPDKTVRIILTGDLLFPSGQADLTPNAINLLKKLSGLLKKTPYMINVIGHTDSQPVRATRYPSNWELSLARASRVARFLIDDTKMPSTQFSVSGYSSFRPVKPNTSEENRKANRRVEIILSKELPQAEAATPANLQ
jgi:chemotaxis protein MotB